MKKYFTLLYAMAFVISYSAFSQQSKLNSDLTRKLNTSASNEEIHLLVKGNVQEIKNEVKKAGGVFKCSAGNIASVQVSMAGVSALLKNKFIERLEYNSRPLEPQMDTVWRQNNNLDSVAQGLGTLPQGYEGQGVIVGIIDQGIDFTHSDFRDSTGSSRILYMWDQTSTAGTAPVPFGYGSEWNTFQINTGVAVLRPLNGSTSHGNRVTSIAVADGDTCHIHRGAAPKADIIVVEYPFSSPPATYVEDATAWIFAKADLEGKPCVINASLGTIYGSHDGTDLRAQFIDSMLVAKNGRAFVAAAGNYGSTMAHLAYDVTSDSAFTWTVKPSSGNILVGVYSDSVDFANVQIAIGADNQPAYDFRGRTGFWNVSNFTMGVQQNDTLWSTVNPAAKIATIQYFPDYYNGVYSLEFIIKPDTTSYYYRVITKGTGKVNSWSFNWVDTAILPTTGVYPEMVHYKLNDSTQNICSSFQCSDKVITVGNYVSRNCYGGHDGNTHCDNTVSAGHLSPQSSRGPTRTGMVKPDISAPGGGLFASTYTSSIATQADSVMGICDIHFFRNDAGGMGITSQASPAVAGLVALYMQKNPNDNWQQIKDAVLHCARQDSITTTALPNNLWGWGKADAYRALAGCDSTVGIAEIPATDRQLQCFPNPFTEQTTISYNFSDKTQTGSEILIFDVFGKVLRKFTPEKSSGSFEFSAKNLSAGIYFCQLRKNNLAAETKKIIILK